jgi:hypothetical protein
MIKSPHGFFIRREGTHGCIPFETPTRPPPKRVRTGELTSSSKREGLVEKLRGSVF